MSHSVSLLASTSIANSSFSDSFQRGLNEIKQGIEQTKNAAEEERRDQLCGETFRNIRHFFSGVTSDTPPTQVTGHLQALIELIPFLKAQDIAVIRDRQKGLINIVNLFPSLASLQMNLAYALGDWYYARLPRALGTDHLDSIHFYAKAIAIADNVHDPQLSTIHHHATNVIRYLAVDLNIYRHRLERAVGLNNEEEFGKVFSEIKERIRVLTPNFSDESGWKICRSLFTLVRDTRMLDRGEVRFPHFKEEIDLCLDLQPSPTDSTSVKWMTERYREGLDQFRADFRKEHTQLVKPGPPSAARTRSFQKEVMKRFREFFNILLMDALKILDIPPQCDFDIRAMGSMGREAPYPFSDLEWFYLIDSEVWKEDIPKLRQLLEMQICSLNEADDPLFLFTSAQNRIGFHLDTHDQGNFIGTSKTLSDEHAELARADRDASFTPQTFSYTNLKSTSLRLAPPKLIEEFHHVVRGIHRLPLEASSKDSVIKKVRHRRAFQVIQERLKAYQAFNLSLEEGAQIDIKKCFMQPLFYLLNDIGIYFGIEKTNTIEIVDELTNLGFFTLESGGLVKQAVADIYLIRVRLQFYYRERRDEVYVTTPANTAASTSTQPVSLEPDELEQLKRAYWLVIAPLYEKIDDFFYFYLRRDAILKLQSNLKILFDLEAIQKKITVIKESVATGRNREFGLELLQQLVWQFPEYVEFNQDESSDDLLKEGSVALRDLESALMRRHTYRDAQNKIREIEKMLGCQKLEVCLKLINDVEKSLPDLRLSKNRSTLSDVKAALKKIKAQQEKMGQEEIYFEEKKNSLLSKLKNPRESVRQKMDDHEWLLIQAIRKKISTFKEHYDGGDLKKCQAIYRELSFQFGATQCTDWNSPRDRLEDIHTCMSRIAKFERALGDLSHEKELEERKEESLADFGKKPLALPEMAFSNALSRGGEDLNHFIFFFVEHLLKSSASLKVHEKWYRALSQQTKTESARRIYFEVLERQHQTPTIQQIYRKLLPIPNRDGLTHLYERDYSLLSQALRGITTDQVPQPIGEVLRVEVSSPTLTDPKKTFYLEPEVARTILVVHPGGRFPVGEIDGYSAYKSMHQVRKLEYKNWNLHFKHKPCAPMMEFAMHSLVSRMMGERSPKASAPTELARFAVYIKGRTKPLVYPVLISETIQGDTLDKVSERKMKNGVIELTSDGEHHFTKLLLCSIMAKLGDGRSPNHIRHPSSKIFMIDTEFSLLEPVVYKNAGILRLRSLQTQFCSVPFLLIPGFVLDKNALEEFCKLEISSILWNWLEEIGDREKKYLNIFGGYEGKEVGEFYEDNDHSIEDEKKRVAIFLPLPKRSVATLYAQFHSLQNFIQKNKGKTIKALDLLSTIIRLSEQRGNENQVGVTVKKSYEIAARKKNKSADEKLDTAVIQDVTLSSSDLLRASLGEIPDFEDIWKQELYTIETAKKDLGGIDFRRQTKTSYCHYEQEKSYFHGDFQNVDLKTQRLAIDSLQFSLEQIKPRSIFISNCETLDLATLTPFLHSGLHSLKLVRCPGLDSGIFTRIMKHSPSLVEFWLDRCCTREEKSSAITFEMEKLEIFHLRHNEGLGKSSLSLIAGQLKEAKITMNGLLTFKDLKVPITATINTLVSIDPFLVELAKREVRLEWDKPLHMITEPFFRALVKLYLSRAGEHWLEREKPIWAYLVDFYLNKIENSTHQKKTKKELIELKSLNDPPCLNYLTELRALEKIILSMKDAQLIDLSGIRLNPRGVYILFDCLCNFPSLEELNLQGCLDLEGSSAIFPRLDSLSSLRVLKLQGNPFPKDHLALYTVVELPTLKAAYVDGFNSLSFKNKGLSDAYLMRLANVVLAHTPFLKDLDLSGNVLQGTGGRAVAKALRSMKGLQTLDLSHNNLQILGAKAIAESFPSLESLRKLNLRSNNLKSEGLKVIAANIRCLTSLQDLDLSDNSLLGQKDIEKLIQFAVYHRSLKTCLFDCPSSFTLSLKGYQLKEEEINCLVRVILPSLKHLEALDLSCTGIDDKGADILAKALASCSSLLFLDLRGNPIHEKGGNALLALLGALPLESLLLDSSNLKAIDLEEKKLDARSVQVLVRDVVSRASRLESLNLAKNTFGDEGITIIADVLPRLTSLCELNFAENRVGDPGAEYLALAFIPPISPKQGPIEKGRVQTLSGPSTSQQKREPEVLHAPLLTLKSLDLSRNFIGERGAVSLIQTIFRLGKIQLESLNLGGLQSLHLPWSLGHEKTKQLAKIVLPHLQSLTSLDLGNNAIGDGMAAIASSLESFTNLKSLNLQNNKLEGFALTTSISSLASLTFLDLSGNPKFHSYDNRLIYDREGKPHRLGGPSVAFGALKSCSSLTHLKLAHNALEKESIAELSSLIQSLPIRSLELCGNPIGDRATVLFNAISQQTTLTFLGLNACGIDDAVVTAILSQRTLSDQVNSPWDPLQELELSQNRVSPEGVKLLVLELLKVPSLQRVDLESLTELDLSGLTLRREEINRLVRAVFPHTPKLNHLNLSNMDLKKEELEQLFQASLRLPSLKSLNLQNNPIGKAGVKAVVQAISLFPKLEELYMSDCALGVEGGRIFEHALQQLPSLKILSMKGNLIGGKSFEIASSRILSNISFQLKLEILHLENNKIGKCQLKNFPKLLSRCFSLKSLSLDSNDLQEEHTSALASSIIGPLAFLSLSNNQIGMEGAQMLAQKFSLHPSLQSLNLTNCSIGEREMVALTQGFKPLTSLSSLELGKNPLGEKGMRSLVSNVSRDLKLLSLENCSFKDKEASILADAIPEFFSIHTMRLSGNSFGEIGLRTLIIAGLNLVRSLNRYPKFDLGNPSALNLDRVKLTKTDVEILDRCFFPHFTNLTSLSMNDCALDTSPLRSRSFPQLTSLSLARNQMGAFAIQRLKDSPDLSGLEILNLEENSIDSNGIRAFIQLLPKLPKLKVLHIGENKIGGAEFAQLIPMLPTTLVSLSIGNITSLDLRGVNLNGERAVRLIQALRLNLVYLTTLDLTNCGLLDAEIVTFIQRGLPCLPALNLLRLGGNQLGASAVNVLARHFLANTAPLPKLDLGSTSSLDFSGIPLQHGLNRLVDAFFHQPLFSLQHLNLTNCSIGGGEMGIIAKFLPKMTALQALLLGNNFIGTSGAKKLKPVLPKLRALTLLDLENTQLRADGVKVLKGGFSHSSSLTTLKLGKNQIGSSAGPDLNQILAQLPSLQVLEMDNNLLDDAAVAAFAPSIAKLTSLQTLKLANNPTGLVAVRKLIVSLSSTVQSLSLKSVDPLDLSGMFFLPQSTHILTHLILTSSSFSKLQTLNLSMSSGVDLKAILPALPNSLKTLNLPRISNKDVECLDWVYELSVPFQDRSKKTPEAISLESGLLDREYLGVLIQKLLPHIHKLEIRDLKNLNLTRFRLDDIAIEFLINRVLCHSPQLESLRLTGCGFKVKGAMILAEKLLPHSPCLKSLDISENWITVRGVHALLGALPSSNLTTLKMHLIGISGGELSALQRGKKNLREETKIYSNRILGTYSFDQGKTHVEWSAGEPKKQSDPSQSFL